MEACEIFGCTLSQGNDDLIYACYPTYIEECKIFRVEIDKYTNRDTPEELISFYESFSNSIFYYFIQINCEIFFFFIESL